MVLYSGNMLLKLFLSSKYSNFLIFIKVLLFGSARSHKSHKPARSIKVPNRYLNRSEHPIAPQKLLVGTTNTVLNDSCP